MAKTTFDALLVSSTILLSVLLSALLPVSPTGGVATAVVWRSVITLQQ